MPAFHVNPRLVAESMQIGPCSLPGELQCPQQASGRVVLAHGSGSSRLTPRNAYVGNVLRSRRLAILLFDLLTEHEAADRRKAPAADWFVAHLVPRPTT